MKILNSRRLFVLLFSAAFITCYAENFNTKTSVRQSCAANEDLATSLIDQGISKNKKLIAGLLRAGFHDCITATASKSGSGCNGSIRLNKELKYKGNRGIKGTIKFLRPIQRRSCMSWADLLQLGVERSMVKSGGPTVSLGRGRSDANSADEDDLPDETASYATLKAYFKKRGFNARMMVVGNVGGHAVGKFRGTNFSANPNKFDNLYAVNLKNILEGGSGLSGFNELDSDLQMIAKNQGQIWIKYYASSSKGKERLLADFKTYLEKQASLSSSNVSS